MKMRAFFVTFLFYVLINIVIGDNVTFKSKTNIENEKSYVKKQVYKGLPVQYINRRYSKKDAGLFSVPVLMHTKKHVENSYTVFPVRHDEIRRDFPDSPYFPLDRNIGDKPSVKRVLPNYEWTARKKRSADVEVGGNKTVTVTEVKGTEATPTVSSNVTPEKAVRTEVKQVDEKAQKVVSDVTQKEAVTKAVEAKKPVKSNEAKVVPVSAAGNSSRRSLKRRRPKLRSKLPSQKGGIVIKRNAPKHAKPAKGKRSGRSRKNKSPVAPKKNAKVKEGRRLISARDALIEEYPYVVSIQKDGEHWCSGAILNQRLVITTANCVWKANRMSRLRVRAGSRFTDRGGQVTKIQEVMKHPGWSIRQKPDHDVALLYLDQNLRFSHSVHSLDLPNRIMMPAFEDAWVTSWGTERRDGVYEKKGMSLQVYHARLLDKDKCNNVTQRYRVRVTENFICLAQTGRRAPCTRDTGAPAVSDGVLWGLASWGIRKLCGTERFPAMFSYVASQGNMDFITNATHFLMSEQRQIPFGDRYIFQQPGKLKNSDF